VSFGKMGAGWATGLLITFALQIGFTAPVAFVLVALIAAALRRRK
jgi:membrane protein implicated in regulation of membrane protease activity